MGETMNKAVAQLRACAVGDDDELVRTVTSAIDVDKPAPSLAAGPSHRRGSREIDDLDAGAELDAALAAHRREERLEEHTAMQADAEEPLAHLLVGEIRDRGAVLRLTEQAIDA